MYAIYGNWMEMLSTDRPKCAWYMYVQSLRNVALSMQFNIPNIYCKEHKASCSYIVLVYQEYIYMSHLSRPISQLFENNFGNNRSKLELDHYSSLIGLQAPTK